MNTGDSLEQRGQSLEDAFFRRVDQELMKQLKEQASSKQGHAALSAACPWASEAVIKQLEAANISCESLVSLTLVPLVRVAWADGRMELNEKNAVLKAASEGNCAEGTPGHKLLESWLDEAPGDDLFTTWKNYVQSLSATLDGEAKQGVREDVVSRARAVAKAAGGILGINSVSDEEEAVLAEIEAAFQ